MSLSLPRCTASQIEGEKEREKERERALVTLLQSHETATDLLVLFAVLSKDGDEEGSSGAGGALLHDAGAGESTTGRQLCLQVSPPTNLSDTEIAVSFTS